MSTFAIDTASLNGFHYDLYVGDGRRMHCRCEVAATRPSKTSGALAYRGKPVWRGVLVAWMAALLCVPLTGRAQELGDLLGTAATCRLLESSFADVAAAPLFQNPGGQCEAALPDADAGRQDWYLDAACSLPVDVAPTSLGQWCDSVLQPSALGEGASDQQTGAPVWRLSPGSRLDLGARSLAGVLQPWLSDTVFRRIDTVGGVCELQMRIHAPRPVVDGRAADGELASDATGLAMIAWHGGSWSNRAFGSVGLELTVPHFTARGFTVYTPFYRLLGDSPDGSEACRMAAFETDVVDDALAAFDWVQANGARYGTQGKPVLFGQSAGGQLAARVAIERPDEVAGAVLFYAPVDFEHFLSRAQSGAYTDEQGLGILERVLGVPAGEADPSASPVPENSLPRRVVRDGIATPPMFMLHGEADALVEAGQSVRLCDALAGRELGSGEQGPASIDPLRRVSLCGERSSLHRIREGGHALDVCPFAGPVALDSCPSGSESSRQRVADSIGSAAVFAHTMAALAAGEAAGEPPQAPLQQGEQPQTDAPVGASRTGGGVWAAWWVIVLGGLAVFRRQ